MPRFLYYGQHQAPAGPFTMPRYPRPAHHSKKHGNFQSAFMLLVQLLLCVVCYTVMCCVIVICGITYTFYTLPITDISITAFFLFLASASASALDQTAKWQGRRSPARSGRPVALLCAVILVVSSRALRDTQRGFGMRLYAYNGHLTLALV